MDIPPLLRPPNELLIQVASNLTNFEALHNLSLVLPFLRPIPLEILFARPIVLGETKGVHQLMETLLINPILANKLHTLHFAFRERLPDEAFVDVRYTDFLSIFDNIEMQLPLTEASSRYHDRALANNTLTQENLLVWFGSILSAAPNLRTIHDSRDSRGGLVFLMNEMLPPKTIQQLCSGIDTLILGETGCEEGQQCLRPPSLTVTVTGTPEGHDPDADLEKFHALLARKDPKQYPWITTVTADYPS